MAHETAAEATPTKRLLRRFYEQAYSLGDYRVVDELFDESFSGNDRPPGSMDVPGPEIVRRSLDNLRTAFPDFRPVVVDLVEEGNTVVAHLNVTGTHLGPLTVRPGDPPLVIEPSGAPIAFHGARIFYFDDGKGVASYAWMEELQILQAIGALGAFAESLDDDGA